MTCLLPVNAPDILPLASQWSQILPSGSRVTSKGVGTGGWAIDPNSETGCVDGAYCPYACATGFIETQFDSGAVRPWLWEAPRHGKINFIGGGRKLIRHDNGSTTTGGGLQGAHCLNGEVILDSPSTRLSPVYQSKLCVDTPKTVLIRNLSSYTVTCCRTVYPGSGIPQIPTVIRPGIEEYLTTIPSCADPAWATRFAPNACQRNPNREIWWSGWNEQECKKPEERALSFYLSRGSEQALEPVCQRNAIRPSTNEPTVSGTDYFPYLVRIPSAQKVHINTNNITEGYDRALGNPGYGIRLIDKMNIVVGSVEYTGPLAPSATATLCEGAECGNSQVFPRRISNGKIRSDCVSLQEGVTAETETALDPIVIELYDVNVNIAIIPSDLCVTKMSSSSKAPEAMKLIPMNNICRQNGDDETPPHRRSIWLWIAIAFGVILLLVIIGVVIWLLLRRKTVKIDPKDIQIAELQRDVERAKGLETAALAGLNVTAPLVGGPSANLPSTLSFSPSQKVYQK